MPRFQQDFAVKRMQGIADTAGIQKQRFPSPVHQGTVGVAKEEKIQVCLLYTSEYLRDCLRQMPQGRYPLTGNSTRLV